MISRPLRALVMVRSGSVRCAKKNTRPFAGLSLLERKLLVLKQLSRLDGIVLSSDSDEMLAIGRRHGVECLRRPLEYASSTTQPPDLYRHVGSVLRKGTVLSASVCCPFITARTYERCLEAAEFALASVHDSVVCCTAVRQYLWNVDREEPVNYRPTAQPNSQDLPALVAVSFGSIVTPVDTLQRGDLIGCRPHFVPIEPWEAWDIDTEEEFLLAEKVYRASQRGDATDD